MTVLPCSELRQSRGRLAWLILLAPLLMQCNPERLVIVHVGLSPEVPRKLAEQVIQFEVRTSLDSFDDRTIIELFDDAGMEKQLPLGIGIYHHQRSGDLKVLVHGLDVKEHRVAGGFDTFKVDDSPIENVDQILFLTPCVDSNTGSPMEICRMPEPIDGGDAGDAGDAGDTNDAGGDAAPDTGGTDEDAGDTGAEPGGCTASDSGTVAFRDIAGPTPADCDSYCTAAIAQCPQFFPGLPSPAPTSEAPAPIDICRLACTAARFDDVPDSDALSCRVTQAMEADGSSARCALATLISLQCLQPACQTFCTMNESICGVAYAACLAPCNKLLYGDFVTEPGGNTLVCRMGWLERAMFDPASCGAAQPQPTCGPCMSGQ